MESFIKRINDVLKDDKIYAEKNLFNNVCEILRGYDDLIYLPKAGGFGENEYSEFISDDEYFIIRIVVKDVRKILIDRSNYTNFYIRLEKQGLEKIESLNKEYSIYKLVGKYDNIE